MNAKSVRKVRYPWDKWFKRKQVRLVKGKDYTCMPHSMAQQVRNAAHLRHRKVSIHIAGTILLVTNRGQQDA